MNYPRVLIIGQAFQSNSGGGITQTNLFKGWPKDKIAVAALGQVLEDSDDEICSRYYQLGDEEYKWKFPFSLFFHSYSSGVVTLNRRKAEEAGKARLSLVLRYFLAGKLVGPFLRWTGIFYGASSLNVSDRFLDWVNSYAPEVVYLQVSTLEGIRFAISICENYKSKYVIHMMDDWPSTIASRGLFKTYWRGKIDEGLRRLMNLVHLHLSIGEAMSTEYLDRYQKEFYAFHNPVELSAWRACLKTEYKMDKGDVKILYAGRIGRGISKSIIEVSKAITLLNSSGYKIALHIQSKSIDISTSRKLGRFSFVKINPPVTYEQIPGIISDSDILLLANDFNSGGNKFLKYSIPTKASEYMMSGVPVLVYAPKEIAVSSFFLKNHCGLCVHDHSIDGIIVGLKKLIDNPGLRETLGTNAKKIASENFDSQKVREDFRESLLRLNK